MEEEGIIITYETLYEILRREKFREELQLLTSDFIKKITNYLRDKEAIILSQEKKRSIFSGETDKIKKEFLNIQKMVKELFERRERKIIDMVLMNCRSGSKPNPKNLLPEENLFLDIIHKNLTEYHERLLSGIIEGRVPEQPKEIKADKNPETKDLLRVIGAIPKFVGKDSKVYGPFEAEDIALLPVDVARLLKNRERVEEMNNNLIAQK